MTTGLAGIKYARGHRLSGFPTDSGYLRVALEYGWIGLIITLVFYAMVTSKGIQAYFNKGDPKMNGLIAAYTCAFFALSVANFTQDAMGQKPMVIIVTGMFTIIPVLYRLKNEKNEND
jgi:O-antigen ligase